MAQPAANQNLTLMAGPDAVAVTAPLAIWVCAIISSMSPSDRAALIQTVERMKASAVRTTPVLTPPRIEGIN